jgi:hypothetical protein
MILELKHLAGYLPYGVKCSRYIGSIAKSIYIDLDPYTINGMTYEDNLYKPILRPLSDLTKEIEVNEEKFVPSQEYNYLRFEEISTFKGGCNAMKFIQARELELLYEMHFDIYGLIEKDLAIDVNTLEK